MGILTEARRERYALLCNYVSTIAIAIAFVLQFGMGTCILWTACWSFLAFFLAAASESFLPINNSQVLDRYLAVFGWFAVITHLLWLCVWHIDEIAVGVKKLIKEILLID